MSAHQADFPIATMAYVLGVSPSGYYVWRNRPASAHDTGDAALLRRIRTIHAASHGTYGAPRVHAELQAEGTAVARKRVARLMRAAGLRGVSRRRFPATTQREPSHRPAHDLVGRDFRAAGPNRLWVADITYVPTAAGFLFLAVVLDAWSRRIVGWAMATDLRTRLVLDALDMAVTTRKPADVIHPHPRCCDDRLNPPNTHRWPSASGAKKQACNPPPDRSAMRMTTPWPRHSSPPWNASCSIGVASDPRPRPAWRCSPSSRASTTPPGATRPWAISRPTNTKPERWP